MPKSPSERHAALAPTRTSIIIFVFLQSYFFPVSMAHAEPNPPGSDQFNNLIQQAKREMLGDPRRARQLGHLAAEQAASWSPGTKREIALATAGWIEGEGAYRLNDIAASLPLIAKSLRSITTFAPGTTLNADLLLAYARILRENREPQRALSDLQRAYNIFVSNNDKRSEAKTLQSIGSIYQDARDYEKVLFYYRSAKEAYPNDPILELSADNNIANALVNLHRFKEAHTAYNKAFKVAKRLNSALLMTQILANIGDLAIEDSHFADAQVAIDTGIRLTSRPGAAGWRPILLGTQAKLRFYQHRLNESKRDLTLAFSYKNATTDQTFKPIHFTAYLLYKMTGNDAKALEHLEVFRRMDEEGRTLATSTNAALMTARFDFANQNEKIATLKAGQLSRDVAITRIRARQSTVIFSGILALLLTMLLFLFVYLRSIAKNRSAIMQSNARLANSNAELGEALDVKSQFLATTSHEIRTPLNGILGMTQVILADVSVAGIVRERVSLVDSAGRAMRALVDDILDFAKMDSGEVRLARVPTNLKPLIIHAVSLWQAQAHEKNISLELTMTETDLTVMTDPSRLQQILSNLLSNATKFTLDGQILVTVVIEKINAKSFVTIALSDSGIGIPSDAYDSIFEPFRQLDTTTTRKFGGTGLGLAISRNLARVLGGDISVISGSSGSTFALRLPYLPSAIPTSESNQPRSEILIVSDNPIRRSLLRAALEHHYGTFDLCNMAEFVKRSTGCSEMVLLDLGDAPAAAELEEAVRSRMAISAPAPIIALVFQSTNTSTLAWLEQAGVVILAKPLNMSTLIASLHQSASRNIPADPHPSVQTVAIVPNLS